ncbi:L,D-transpeptidase [Rhodoplanes sp. Z2-YC6860]|uniref:L,D-transpeptidase n=1 Tax=Rhodoplanes sp. Z2-YC6860 TaxID=674703 RepID=UPI00078E01B2|nr:L,D-transpeptidase [Rhodoplanes sp. Z2-YC6860]AMN41562.1 ErfK/YbiS/YcfS/YnhG family protein [Rhodoplanes sp. Z2-YC6860]
MLLRLVSAVLALAALAGSVDVANAQAERMLMLNGGAPRANNFNFFGFSGTDTTKSRVNYSGSERPGTIVINTAERRLYLVEEGGSALRYGVGVGRIGFTWKGTHRITAKKEWPTWTPPPEMRRRVRGLPAQMAGGIDNPLGARAMYLGSTLYRIHGSNEPETIGQAVSSGCFRMTNDDVQDLYNRVAVGTTVIVR